MAKRKFVKQALSQWMNIEGADSDVVISSRVRIARNIRSYAFSNDGRPRNPHSVMEQLLGVAESGRLMDLGKLEQIRLADLTELEKQVLVEKHLISPNLANESRNGALILSPNEDISIMINEEDHLRIQCLCPGFQVQ